LGKFTDPSWWTGFDRFCSLLALPQLPSRIPFILFSWMNACTCFSCVSYQPSPSYIEQHSCFEIAYIRSFSTPLQMVHSTLVPKMLSQRVKSYGVWHILLSLHLSSLLSIIVANLMLVQEYNSSSLHFLAKFTDLFRRVTWSVP